VTRVTGWGHFRECAGPWLTPDPRTAPGPAAGQPCEKGAAASASRTHRSAYTSSHFSTGASRTLRRINPQATAEFIRTPYTVAPSAMKQGRRGTSGGELRAGMRHPPPFCRSVAYRTTQQVLNVVFNSSGRGQPTGPPKHARTPGAARTGAALRTTACARVPPG
jgi:hypothetical protein